jgi:glycosyltransferase involved in cell wall biosynthesis
VGWQDDVLSYIAAGDLLLHVAEYEGLPLAIVEAMAAGLPCAVTGQFLSEVSIFDRGTILCADDLPTLRGCIGKPDELTAIAYAAQRLVKEKLSIRAMTEAYERVYAAACSRADMPFCLVGAS